MSTEERQVVVVASPAEAEVLCEVLQAAGYRVHPAHDLSIAEQLAREVALPALILLDEPPRSRVPTFLAALKRARPGEVLPVVLITALAGNDPFGVSEVVAKPFVAPLLLEVVQRLFEAL